MGTDICVCPMVSITSATDYTIDMLDNSRVTECLDRIVASTIKPIMIKPHIGLNFRDDFNRKYYIPSNIEQFFSNWTNILLNYATICDTYNIPLLCVSVEMVELTKNIYANYWEILYNTIKASHPNVKIIHAPKVWEFNDYNHEYSLQWADILGCTFYTNYSSKSFVGDTVDIWEDVGKAFYSNENSFINVLNSRCSKYNKKFYIAEIGCMPLQDGLTNVIPKSYAEGVPIKNYYVQSALMEVFFNIYVATQML